MDITPKFQPRQIVSLDYQDQNLYAEVIEIVVSRQLCWVRPLLLVDSTQELPLVIDLRNVSDLLWPLDLFRPALDTEVIAFLGQIFPKEQQFESDLVAKQQFNLFIHQLWQAYQQEQTIYSRSQE
ncbi:hypothetical protein [Anabaena sp. UHCC 0204]|uniref:hypothetical protein n=1 Tax=Anabaena sp. UHCC 0204 TaxID=2590009 RepID=UPI00157FD8B2|nr:hypothetical protein [Anabaena sp. UHCC 0204]